MDVKVFPSKIFGDCNAPASKSVAHRLLIASALADRPTMVRINCISDDVIATKNALIALGATISETDDGFLVSPLDIKNSSQNAVTIDCNESGSTLRFLIPIAASLGKTATFVGRGRLAERPLGDILNALSNGHGVSFSSDKLPLTVSGKLLPGTYEIDGSVSSQFVTGLLFALSIVGDSALTVVGNRVSLGYIKITEQVLKIFNSALQTAKYGYIFNSAKCFSSPGAISAEGDASQAAFFASAAAIGGKIKIYGININTAQGDFAIFDVLNKFGANVTITNDFIEVSCNKLNGIELSVKDIPDLAPIISVVAAYAQGETILNDAERLRIKESDRLSAILEMLASFGIKAEEKNGAIKIYGGSPIGGIVDGKNDHRIVMSSAICASFAGGNTVITSAEAVNKSYPKFFEDFTKVGGKYDRI